MAIGVHAAVADAGVIFSEDFESLTDGNLVGQGGWTGDAVNLSSSGTHLGTRVSNGLQFVGPSTQHATLHALALPTTGRVVVDFDAFAITTTSPRSHNSGLLVTAPVAPGGSQLFAGWFNNSFATDGPKWTFEETLSGNALFAFGGHDEPVSLAIVLDYDNNEIFGRYDFGSGVMETTKVSVSAADLQALNSLTIANDFRGTLGVELDNITVNSVASAVPEPSSLVLLGIGTLCLIGYRRKRRQTIIVSDN